MSDYIKREDASEPLYERWKAAESRSDDDIAEIVKMDYITVSNVPSADVAEVVRCKDCKYNPKSLGWVACPMTGANTRKDGDYCSYGEREEQEHE